MLSVGWDESSYNGEENISEWSSIEKTVLQLILYAWSQSSWVSGFKSFSGPSVLNYDSLDLK